ncbi:ATP-binding protein [Paenibacillus glacialis]|uniref:ATP-binding protein n=1 Tax=Paenibacillus glacialis TaxID=494026 RepID=UPI0009FDA87F|nr:ATP-binding protein [Paenibacillus glacialis]
MLSSEQYDGTGLGLSICKQLVELMNGRIWLEESTDKGSTFNFELTLGSNP